MNKESKIYVAGHRGLVGSALVKNLNEKGYTNLVVRTSSELDLRDAVQVAAFFKEEQPEYVFLAAAKVGGIVANNTYRADFIYENLMIQNNVVHQAYVYGVKKLLFLGSTCIYPKDCPQPMKEEYLLTDVLEYTNEPYAIAKIAGIKLCESYNLQYGTNFISVMPTNLYGPNDNFDLEKSHVLPALIRKMHLGKALEQNDWDSLRADLNKLPIEGVDGSASDDAILGILKKYGISRRLPAGTANSTSPSWEGQEGASVQVEIWGSGKPMREFLWSEDMADACVFIMENRDFADVTPSAVEGPHANTGEIRNTHINIGTGEDISIKDLAELIKKIVDFKGKIYFNTEKPDGTMKKLTDVSKLKSLGWSYIINLRKGISDLYAWYL
ncbi:GDP-L-fucose synthase family protein [Leeuwenhoekiella parthenopeia]|uniref:GDP-L-fucose synthase n=1 Tax=Leeuwenhoekiella parthenopeia TaxID=2890320 RepID=A0ABS8GWT1_9FLAO|nr:GDP-L-fucose synthase [Leeuwenhoekiella parthenopeia]MCC4214256.1 GDP-L-fucose synthase [Leeuwenhoekiella parthenopeia]